MNHSVLLIVENKDLLGNLEYILREEKFRVFTADEGLSALTTLSFYAVDLIVIDTPVSLISLIDFLRILNENPSLRFIPKVVFNDQEEDVADINLTNFSNLHIFKKPFTLSHFSRFIWEKISESFKQCAQI